MTNTEELIAKYRATAAAWGQLQDDAKKANPLFVRLHGIYKQVRASETGRNGITALMEDASLGVRLVAASHSLGWTPQKATAVLEAVGAGRGLHAVTAKYTLKSFREGRLNMDW